MGENPFLLFVYRARQRKECMNSQDKPLIILASASPRRVEILKNHGIKPIVMPSNAKEILPSNLAITNLPEDEQEEVDRRAVEYLAELKVKNVADLIISKGDEFQSEQIIIIGADTMVFKGEKLGKPKDKDDAYRMIDLLQGDRHKVITGVAMLRLDFNDASKKLEINSKDVFCCETIVSCYKMTEEEIDEYVNMDEPYDKAGAYAIQGCFQKYIEKYEGDFENVMGLPYFMIEDKLKECNK